MVMMMRMVMVKKMKMMVKNFWVSTPVMMVKKMGRIDNHIL